MRSGQADLVAKDQQDARITDGHGHTLTVTDALFKQEPAQHQDQRGVEVKDQPLQ